jgi:N-terminal domain of galactosyltransferase
MNRLAHIAATLPQNLLDNRDYPDVDFVILNYNSKDELQKYILDTFGAEIRSGRISYYRTAQPDYFDRSHSRNVAFRLAQGDILCNLDSDNFTGPGFAAYLNDLFCTFTDIFVSAPFEDNIAGRIAMRKQDYLSTRGYDQRLMCYGYEDDDMICRLETNGLRKVIIDDKKFLNAIGHPAAEKIENEYIKRHLLDCYVRYITPSISETIILLKDGRFLAGTLIDYDTLKAELDSGRPDPLLDFIDPGFREGRSTELTFGPEKDILLDPDRKIFHRLSGKEEIIDECILFFSQQFNRSILDGKNDQPGVTINPNGFGSATVYRNYDQNTALTI